MFTYQNNFGGPISCMLSLTIDTDGFLYVTIWLGGVVLKINPRYGPNILHTIKKLNSQYFINLEHDFTFFSNRKVVQVIEIPVKLVDGIAWGGKDHKTLFVTTSSPFFNINTGAVSDFDESYTSNSGKVYAVTGLNATGVVTNNLHI